MRESKGHAAKHWRAGVLHVSNLYHTAPMRRLARLLCETSFADKVHFCQQWRRG